MMLVYGAVCVGLVYTTKFTKRHKMQDRNLFLVPFIVMICGTACFYKYGIAGLSDAKLKTVRVVIYTAGSLIVLFCAGLPRSACMSLGSKCVNKQNAPVPKRNFKNLRSRREARSVSQRAGSRPVGQSAGRRSVGWRPVISQSANGRAVGQLCSRPVGGRLVTQSIAGRSVDQSTVVSSKMFFINLFPLFRSFRCLLLSRCV